MSGENRTWQCTSENTDRSSQGHFYKDKATKDKLGNRSHGQAKEGGTVTVRAHQAMERCLLTLINVEIYPNIYTDL